MVPATGLQGPCSAAAARARWRSDRLTTWAPLLEPIPCHRSLSGDAFVDVEVQLARRFNAALEGELGSAVDEEPLAGIGASSNASYARVSSPTSGWWKVLGRPYRHCCIEPGAAPPGVWASHSSAIRHDRGLSRGSVP